MKGEIKKNTVNLDGFHSLTVTVCESERTVIAELATPDEPPVMIYAEKFDEPCNYVKAAIRRGIEYLNAQRKLLPEKRTENNFKKI